MLRHLCAIGVLVVVVGAAAAAQPFPGAVLVNGGWVPCTHQIAIDAGLGCVAPTPTVAGVPAVVFEVGRFYRTPSGQCDFKLVAVGATYQHRRPMLVGETIRGRAAGCPEVAYFFDPSRTPEPGWLDITESIPPEAR